MPPHDLDAEAAVVGGMLFDARAAVDVVGSGLSSTDFYHPAHQHIFEAMRLLVAAGKPVDNVIVADRLRRAGLLDDIGGKELLVDLQAATPASSNVAHYGRIVRDAAVLRRLLGVLAEITDTAYSNPADVGAAVAAAAVKVQQVQQLAPFHPNGDTATSIGFHDVTAAEFAAVDEPGADPIVGTVGDVVIPMGGDVMFYGDGGAGKTTLCLDLACHLGSGCDWLDVQIPAPRTVLVIENEGPRPLFRGKVRRKLAAWTAPLGDRWRVIEEPWAELNLADEGHRGALAALIAARDVDVVIIGPLATSGMVGAGTLQEARGFLALCGDVRRRSGRPVTFVVIHHENKGGKVSGAWEGAGDTLIHVTSLGHGRTRIYVQKARWSTTWHCKTLELRWTDGESFEIIAEPEQSDDDVLARLLDVIGENPGIGWTKAMKLTRGRAADALATLRDRLFADGLIVNIVHDHGVEKAINSCPSGRPAKLFRVDDPTIAAQLILGSESAENRSDSVWGRAGTGTDSPIPVRSRESVGESVDGGDPRARRLEETTLPDSPSGEPGATPENTS